MEELIHSPPCQDRVIVLAVTLHRFNAAAWWEEMESGDQVCLYVHDDVMEWKRFQYKWPFVRGIHWPVLVSPHKEPMIWSFGVSFDVSLNKLLNKQSSWQFFEMPWCLCDVITVMRYPRFKFHISIWESEILVVDFEITNVNQHCILTNVVFDNWQCITLHSRYIAVVFLRRTGKRRPIARPREFNILSKPCFVIDTMSCYIKPCYNKIALCIFGYSTSYKHWFFLFYRFPGYGSFQKCRCSLARLCGYPDSNDCNWWRRLCSWMYEQPHLQWIQNGRVLWAILQWKRGRITG